MLTFKTIEKEQEKQMKNALESSETTLPSDDKERKKKLIKYALIGGAALVGGFLIYKYVIVKKTSGNNIKTAEF